MELTENDISRVVVEAAIEVHRTASRLARVLDEHSEYGLVGDDATADDFREALGDITHEDLELAADGLVQCNGSSSRIHPSTDRLPSTT